MKVVGKIIGIIVLVIILLPILTVGTVALLGYDGKTYKYEGDANIKVQELVNDKVVESMDNTRSTGKMNIEITQDDLNCMLQYTLNSNEQLQTYIRSAHVEINGDNYLFHVGANLSGYKTTLALYTKLDYSDKNSDDGDEIFTFQINKVKIGKLPNMTGIAKKALKKYVPDETINDALADAGLHMKADLGNLVLTYKESDILNDITTMVGAGTEGSETNLIFSFLSDFFKNDYITPDFNSSLKAIVNLDNFSTGSYLTKDKELNLDLDSLITKMNTLFDANIIDKANFDKVYQYLIYGYNHSDVDAQKYVDTKDFSSIGISNVKAYDGIGVSEDKSLVDVVSTKIPKAEDLLSMGAGTQITFMNEDDINNYLKTKGLVGYSSLFTSTDGTNINYITIDNFYCNMFVDDTDRQIISFVAGLSVNGYETYVTFNMTHDPENDPDDMAMKFKADKFYFGNYQTTGAISDYLFSIMASVLEEDQTIIVNYEEKSVTIDFETIISKKEGVLDVINTLGKCEMNLSGASLADDGKITAKIVAAD